VKVAVIGKFPKVIILLIMSKKGKITGIGGIFFKSSDPKKSREWYAKNLGIDTNDYGASFKTRNIDNSDEVNVLQWSPFKNDTDYFEPSKKEFMINYRVENLVELVEDLKLNGVTICDELATFDYGKFIHILDEDGNKIELWEPIN
jgi:predicted enzyme related to lactoylglutathione lyase